MGAIRYNSFDAVKACAAIAVVLIHYPFSGRELPKEISQVVRSTCV